MRYWHGYHWALRQVQERLTGTQPLQEAASLGTGTSYTTPSISATTTYYVDATSGTCTTATRTAVIATVNAVPVVDAGTNQTIPYGTSTVLNATVTGYRSFI